MSIVRGKYIRPFPTGSAPGPVAALAEAFRAQVATLEQAEAKAGEIARDPNLTPVGRKTALRSWALTGPVEALRKGRTALEGGDRAIAEIKARMTGATVDKADFAGAMVRSDIRKWIAAMPPAERTARLATGEYDPATVTAILEAPPELSGLSPEQHSALATREIIAKNPEEAELIAKIEEAMGAVADADRATTLTLETDAGLRASEISEALGGQTLSQRLAAMIGGDPEQPVPAEAA